MKKKYYVKMVESCPICDGKPFKDNPANDLWDSPRPPSVCTHCLGTGVATGDHWVVSRMYQEWLKS